MRGGGDTAPPALQVVLVPGARDLDRVERPQKLARSQVYGILVVVSAVGVIALASFLQYWDDIHWAQQVGDSCEDHVDCRGSFPKQFCIEAEGGNYCTGRCEVAADCLAQWQCVQSYVDIGTHRGRHLPQGESFNPDSEQEHIMTCRRP